MSTSFFRRTCLVLALLAGAVRLAAVQIGDTAEQVITEKGKAAGEMKVGAVRILNYPDQTIKLTNGRVSEIGEPAPAAPAERPAATSGPAAVAPKLQGELIKPGEWTDDCRRAIAQGKQQHRQVLLLFTGLDWSEFSQRLQKEILSTPEFLRYAHEHLLLVMLDFPRKTPQPDIIKGQNETLLKTFKIERLPMMVLLSSEGKTLGMLAFAEGGPGKFVMALRQLSATH